jgi:hypothetical protein
MLTYAGAFALGRITGPHLGGDTGLAVVLLSGQALSLSLSLSLSIPALQSSFSLGKLSPHSVQDRDISAIYIYNQLRLYLDIGLSSLRAPSPLALHTLSGQRDDDEIVRMLQSIQNDLQSSPEAKESRAVLEELIYTDWDGAEMERYRRWLISTIPQEENVEY